MTESAASQRELIAFRIGRQEFCVDIMSVREIRGWTPATPLPRSPGYMKGVINLRGTVLPIIDLGARFGLETSEPTARHVIMVANIGGRTVGLLVDAVFTRDLPVIQGVVLVSAIAVFLVSFLVDLAYAAVDPRIRYH